MRRITSLFLVLIATTGVFVRAQNSQLKPLILQKIEENRKNLNGFYLDLHRNPELSMQEFRTSEKMASRLRSLGFELTTGFGGTGVVGILRNGEGPVILLRTDMDALPVTEATGLPYASQVKAILPTGAETGVMHACGHDFHMTVFYGSAMVLSSLRKHWSGTLIMIAQPAEEIGLGALGMLNEGLYNRFPVPDAALALHVSPELEAGTTGICPGPAFAGVNSINITIYGKGGHGAYPQESIDPVVIASRIVLALQTIVSRELHPTEPAVLTVGSIHGGSRHNIIPDHVDLQITLRSYSPETSVYMKEAIRRICNGIAASAGLEPEQYPSVTEEGVYLPPVINDPELSARAEMVHREFLGEKNVLRVPPLMAGEDFGRYGQTPEKVPVFMYWLGVVAPEKYRAHKENGKELPPLHSPEFAPETDISLTTGILGTVSLALDLFHDKPE